MMREEVIRLFREDGFKRFNELPTSMAEYENRLVAAFGTGLEHGKEQACKSLGQMLQSFMHERW